MLKGILPPPPPQPIATRFTLPEVTIVNPGQPRREPTNLAIGDGVVQEIERLAQTSLTLSQYSASFVLPGLVDMHTHIPPDNIFGLVPYACLLYLAFGVTSVRETGDIDGTAVPAARRGVTTGEFPGPRVFACGPYIAGKRSRWPNTIILGDPANADRVVNKIKNDGFNCVKAYDDLTAPQIRALKAAADKYDLPLIGHIPTQISYDEGLVPEVQHLLGVPDPSCLRRDHIFERVSNWQSVDENRMQQIVEATIRCGIANTPTLVFAHQLLLYEDYAAALRDPIVQLMPRSFTHVLWHPTRGLPFYRNLFREELDHLHKAVQVKKELVGRLYRAGAKLFLGTDTLQPFVVPGASMKSEMQRFAECGVPTERVWELATAEAGKTLRTPMLGTIQKGAPADLLIFQRDPTSDLSAMDSLRAVIAQGRLYRIEDLQAGIEHYQQRFHNAVYDRFTRSMARLLIPIIVKRNY